MNPAWVVLEIKDGQADKLTVKRIVCLANPLENPLAGLEFTKGGSSGFDVGVDMGVIHGVSLI